MLASHINFMRCLVSSSAFGNPFNPLCFVSKLFVSARKCTGTSNSFIGDDESEDFVMKGGIATNYKIFCLIDSVDVELTFDRVENFLRLVNISEVTSSEFSKNFRSN